MFRRSLIGLATFTALLAASTSNGQVEPDESVQAQERAALLATAIETGIDSKVSVTEAGGGTVILVPKARPKQAARDEEVEEDPEEARAAKVARETPDYSVSEENFDLWVFGGVAGGEARRAWLDVDLRVKLKGAVAEHGLTEAEASKLRMAGRGDIKRFFDTVEARRREFQIARDDCLKGIKVLAGLRPISRDFNQGLLGDASIFAKTLAKILADRTH